MQFEGRRYTLLRRPGGSGYDDSLPSVYQLHCRQLSSGERYLPTQFRSCDPNRGCRSSTVLVSVPGRQESFLKTVLQRPILGKFHSMEIPMGNGTDASIVKEAHTMSRRFYDF